MKHMVSEQEKCVRATLVHELLQRQYTLGPLRVVEEPEFGGSIRIDAGPLQTGGDPDWGSGGVTLIDEGDLDSYASQEIADRHRANYYLWATAPELVDAVVALRGVLQLHGLEADAAAKAAMAQSERALFRALTLPARPSPESNDE